jgi:hypothetical protein
MEGILFKRDNKILGLFNDKIEFKTKTFHHILDYLISKSYFKTKKQCGTKIKNDLKLFYSENDYTFLYKDIKFEKTTFKFNVIEKVVKEIKSNNFICYKITELSKPIVSLEVKDLMNKIE